VARGRYDDAPQAPGPTKSADDPLRHFTIERTDSGRLEFGWIDPLPRLTPDAQACASYTIQLLGLNTRDLPKERGKTLNNFASLLDLLERRGPDATIKTGTSVRELFAEILSARHPYLAAIRQWLHEEPALKQQLLKYMPGLQDVLAPWDLPP